MRALYSHRLRGLRALPSDLTAETLCVAASEKMTGPVENSLGTDGAGDE
jgi:hypothetical protein